MQARYNEEGEFTHFENKEDQQFTNFDRGQYQQEQEELEDY